MADRFLDENVDIHDHDGIRTITFSSGHRLNPMTRFMVERLHEAVTGTDPDQTRVLVLRGRPVFGCGAHLGELAELSAPELEAFVERELALAQAVQDIACLTVGILQGACLGNAAELALACDLRVAATSTVLGWPEIKAGFGAPTHQLLRYLHPGTAAQLLLTGDPVDATRSHHLGLVTAIVSDDTIDADANRHIQQWAELPSAGISTTKERLREL